jgi:SAM-dependent methyltransferase
MFTYMLHGLAVAYTRQTDDVLCIGMGVGIVPMEFARSGARVDVVEINPAVIPIAQNHFNFEPDKVNLFVGDGRYFVHECESRYDAVLLDAFLGDSSPSHLMSREAFEEMRRVLKPGGVLVINCFGDFDPDRDFFVASLAKTLAAVFPSVKCHNERNGGNVFFVASPAESLPILRPVALDHVHASARGAVDLAWVRVVETHPDHGIILTDDFNPVEFFDARNREDIRRYLAQTIQNY